MAPGTRRARLSRRDRGLLLLDAAGADPRSGRCAFHQPHHRSVPPRALEHAEWLGLLLEHEVTLPPQKRLEARGRTARLRHNASVEDIDYRAARGIDRAMFLKLAACDFIRER